MKRLRRFLCRRNVVVTDLQVGAYRIIFNQTRSGIEIAALSRGGYCYNLQRVLTSFYSDDKLFFVFICQREDGGKSHYFAAACSKLPYTLTWQVKHLSGPIKNKKRIINLFKT